MYYLVPPAYYYDYGGGGSEQWEDDFKPAEVNPEIVEFALTQFSGIDGNCYNVEVENFQRLVVGLEYKFDLVLKTKRNLLPCQPGMGHGDSCHVEVFYFPWKHYRGIDWDQTTCSRKKLNPEQGEHILLTRSISLIKIIYRRE